MCVDTDRGVVTGPCGWRSTGRGGPGVDDDDANDDDKVGWGWDYRAQEGNDG